MRYLGEFSKFFFLTMLTVFHSTESTRAGMEPDDVAGPFFYHQANSESHFVWVTEKKNGSEEISQNGIFVRFSLEIRDAHFRIDTDSQDPDDGQVTQATLYGKDYTGFYATITAKSDSAEYAIDLLCRFSDLYKDDILNDISAHYESSQGVCYTENSRYTQAIIFHTSDGGDFLSLATPYKIAFVIVDFSASNQVVPGAVELSGFHGRGFESNYGTIDPSGSWVETKIAFPEREVSTLTFIHSPCVDIPSGGLTDDERDRGTRCDYPITRIEK